MVRYYDAADATKPPMRTSLCASLGLLRLRGFRVYMGP